MCACLCESFYFILYIYVYLKKRLMYKRAKSIVKLLQ